MIFSSIDFLLFFMVVFPLHWVIPGMKARQHVLLVASLFFYMSWNPKYIVFILFSSMLDYWMA
ncbi:MAG: MBOAT family protein, partial [Planctomycetota bacterium]